MSMETQRKEVDKNTVRREEKKTKRDESGTRDRIRGGRV